MSATRELTVGLVGCGHWGVNILRDLQILGCSVPVVAHSDETRERAVAGGASAVVTEIADLPELDGVVVATPSGTHGAIVDDLLSRDIPIFVEKPLASDVDTAARIATQGGDRVFEMHKWRYHPGIEALAEIARSGDLGHVVGLQTVRGSWGENPDDVDSVWHLVPHDLSIALEVLGEVLEPRALVAQSEGGRLMGIVALMGVGTPWHVIDMSARAPARRREMTLYCEGGSARLADAFADALVIRRGVPKAMDEGEPELLPISKEWPLLRELRAFVAHLTGGPPPRSSAAESLVVARALDALHAIGVGDDRRDALPR
jgi:predicted dehydrogenase